MLRRLFLFIALNLYEIIKASNQCMIKCKQQQQFLCIEDHVSSIELEQKLRNVVKKNFSVCHLDTETNVGYKVHLDSSIWNLELDQPTIAITFVQCPSSSNFFDISVSARHLWQISGCRLDFSLVLNVVNSSLVPYLLQAYPRRLSTATNFLLKTEKEYKLASADELLTELVAKVDASRQPYEAITTEEEEGFVQAHWPTWAIVLCLGCIFLTIIAFLVGIHLSKRRTPLRSKGQQTTKKKAQHRAWGAGFSGGLWQSGGSSNTTSV